MKLNLLTASWLLGLSAKKPNYYNQSFAEITENQLAGSNSASPLGEVEGNESKRVQVKPLNRQNENNMDRFCNIFALNSQNYYYILSGLLCFTNISSFFMPGLYLT